MITPEMQVLRSGEVTWKLRFRHRGRSTSKTFSTEKGAVAFAKLVDQLGVDRALDVIANRVETTAAVPTLAAWCVHHADSLSGVEGETVRRYKAYVENDLGELGSLPIDAITEELIAGWVNAMTRSGAAGKTIANKHGFVSGALERAVGRHISANPCRGTRLPVTISEEMVILSHEEYASFLEFFTPTWRSLVGLLFSTGLRWSEATALQVRDIDLDARKISITRAWKKATGAPGGKILGPPKTPKSRRQVTIAPETVDMLRPLVAHRGRDAWVFVSARGDWVRHQTFHDNVWTPAVRLANGETAQREGAKRIARRRDASGNVIEPASQPIGKHPRIHDARHTNASWLLGAGVPIHVVQAHLGHESITTTVDRYGHLMPGASDAVSAAISAAIGGPVQHPPTDRGAAA